MRTDYIKMARRKYSSDKINKVIYLLNKEIKMTDIQKITQISYKVIRTINNHKKGL